MALRVGRLRHLIVIQQVTETQDSFGSPSESWAEFCQLRGEVMALAGDEAVAAGREVADRPHQIRTRHHPGVRPKMRALVPSAATTLAANLGDEATALTVASADAFPVQGDYRIRIGSELLLVTAGQGTTSWTVTRGVDGSTAAEHSSGDAVELLEVHDILSAPDPRGRRRELVMETVVHG